MSNLSCGTHVAEPSANKDCRKLLNQFCRFLPKLKLPISADAKLPLTHGSLQVSPPWHTTLLAKCSVLYLLAWLTGETGCGASCAPFAPAGKQAEFLRMGMSKKSACFQRTAAGI